MTTSTLQPSAGGGGIACEYRELHGANIHSAESVLVVRIAPDGAGGLAPTLERPSAPLDNVALALEALGLSAAEVRTRERWPLAALVQTVAEQLVRRVNLPAGAPAPAAPADPARELVLNLEAAAPVRASCELAAALVSAAACAPGPPAAQEHDRLRGLLDDFDRSHPPLWPRTAELVAACRQRDIPWCPIEGLGRLHAARRGRAAGPHGPDQLDGQERHRADLRQDHLHEPAVPARDPGAVAHRDHAPGARLAGGAADRASRRGQAALGGHGRGGVGRPDHAARGRGGVSPRQPGGPMGARRSG